MDSQSRAKTAVFVTTTNIALNTLLAALKLIAGIISRSSAMVSDAVHSLSDVFSSVIVIIGIKSGAKKPDDNHQYGHERFESVAAILLSGILGTTGALIGWAGVQQIIRHTQGYTIIPGSFALVAAVISVLVKEGMYWRTRHYAKRLNSSALMADAWHNRSDALSSVGSFIGVFGARMGISVLDPIASVAISALILKAAVDIFRDAVSKMTDRALDAKTVDEITEIVLANPEVQSLDILRTRTFGDRAYVDVEVSVDRHMPLHLAHDVSIKIHRGVEDNFPQIKHCMVHLNPTKE